MRKISVPPATFAALLCLTLPALAQEQVEWTEVLNLPKGHSLPSGVTADILGIEIGDSYAVAKGKLETLLAESANPPQPEEQLSGRDLVAAMERQTAGEIMGERPPLVETRSEFRLQSPGSATVYSASYVSELSLMRDVKAESGNDLRETITLKLSSPASGHQVVGIYRSILYLTNERAQPRVDDLRASLAAKFQAEPQYYQSGNHYFVYQFNDGAAYTPPNAHLHYCTLDYRSGDSSSNIPSMNRTGDCDVVLRVEMRPGISAGHVGTLIFELSDNERSKANFGADYDFFRAYIDNLRSSTSGAVPKL